MPLAPLSRRARLTFAALLVGTTLALPGCIIVNGAGTTSWNESAPFEQTLTLSTPHVDAAPLRIETRNGAITVERGEVAEVQITAKVKAQTEARLAAVTITANRDPATNRLEIKAVAPEGGRWKSGEGVSFALLVPSGVPVSANTSNGQIKLRQMSGKAELDTSNGAIDVAQHDGPIKADTSNGRIEIAGATGAVEAETSNGAIVVSVAPQGTGPVNLDTSNGSISLELPTSYSGVIAADTSNGSIAFPESGAPRLIINRRSRSNATLTLNEGGPKSVLDTSNGSITVKFAAGQ